MIIDKLENASRYYAIHPKLEHVLRFLQEHKEELTAHPLGPVQLTDEISMKYLSYRTVVGSRKWESHVKYTDVQYMSRGSERIGFNNAEHMVSAAKQEGKDQILHDGDGDRILVPEGYFIILFPGEAHMSKLAAAGCAEEVQKVSFKVPL